MEQEALRGLKADWAADRRTFPMSWGKAMMWLFILGDAFVFGTFLISYLAARAAR